MRAPDRVIAGIGLMLTFSALAPVMDMFAKMAGPQIPPAQIALARFAVQVAAMAGLLAAAGRLTPPPRADIALHALRGGLVAAATIMFFTAIAVMPLADAIAVFFVEPMILTLLSGLVLGESVGWRRHVACLVGFAGALLVIQPSFADFGWRALAPVGAATCFAFYLITTRRLAARAEPLAMQLWGGLASCFVLAVALGVGAGAGVAAFTPVAIGWGQAALLLGVGVAGASAHLAITAAFARAPASVLAPFQYLEIVTAVAIGCLAFGDFPRGSVWLGIGVIVGAGLVILRRERIAARAGDAGLTPG